MAVRKTLYQILQVSRTATPEVLSAAYEARLRALGESAAPEVVSERHLLREAHDILVDPVRKKLYDDKLREEAMRALSSGGEPERIRPAQAGASAPADRPSHLIIALAVAGAVAVGGGWVYIDGKRKAEALRIEQERAAAEQKLREAEEQRRQEQLAWQREQQERARQQSEERRFQYDRDRESQRWRYEQERVAQRDRMEQQRSRSDQQRAEHERQRQEQESIRRSQQQVERDRRHLQELERNRGMKF